MSIEKGDNIYLQAETTQKTTLAITIIAKLKQLNPNTTSSKVTIGLNEE